MTSDGWDEVSRTKKKSASRPDQAVPSARSLASNVAVMAARRPRLWECARSISCGAELFSADATVSKQNKTNRDLRIGSLIYSSAYRLSLVSNPANTLCPKAVTLVLHRGNLSTARPPTTLGTCVDPCSLQQFWLTASSYRVAAVAAQARSSLHQTRKPISLPSPTGNGPQCRS